MMGEFFLDYMAAEMGGEAKVGIVGALNSSIQNIRQAGFVDTISSADGVTMATVVDGQNVQDLALSAAENLIYRESRSGCDLCNGRTGASGRDRRRRKPGQAGLHPPVWLGPDRTGDRRHRRRLCHRRHPAGPRPDGRHRR